MTWEEVDDDEFVTREKELKVGRRRAGEGGRGGGETRIESC